MMSAPADPDYRRQREQDGAVVVSVIETLGARGLSIEADLSDLAAPSGVFDRVEAELGPVSILVNNASAGGRGTFARNELTGSLGGAIW